MKKIFLVCILILTMTFALFGCVAEPEAPPTPPGAVDPPPTEIDDPEPTPPPTPEPQPEETTTLEDLMQNTIPVTITMEDGSEIGLELFTDLAPQSVRNFVYLARQGFYDGLRFHRIMSGFMIQGGCPDATGGGGPGYTIKGEFEANGFQNDLRHTPGILSMARRGDMYDSAGSQFFIMHGNAPGLDGDYAGFGRVTRGLTVVDEIAQTPNSGPNGAVAFENMPVIASITIDSDIELPPPDKIT
jgi:peptidyl-prolyl cis-trans isomerase B (cyclophilin B)